MKLNKIKTTLMIAVLLISTLTIAIPLVSATEIPVSPGTGTLEAAITGATAGDILVLASGTYNEGQVLIDKNIAIIGDSTEKPVIRPTTDLTDGDGSAAAWFLVAPGVSFDLSNVVIDGGEFFLYQAIRSHGDTNIDNVEFCNIQGSTSGSPYRGIAVSSFGGTVPGGGGSDSHGAGGSPSHLTVTDSTFEQIGRIGVLVKGDESTANIVGCTYTGKGDGDWLDYAFEAGAGGEITVEGCDITSCTGIASDDSTSAGILVTTYYGPGTQADIIDNDIYENTEGIAVGYDDDDTSVVVAHYNNILENTLYGVATTAPTVDATLNWWGTTVELDISAMVSGLVDYDPWYDALEVTVDGDGTVDAPDAGTTVTYDDAVDCTITVEDLTEDEVSEATFSAVGKYVDVKIDDPTSVDELTIKLHYKDSDLVSLGLVESKLVLYWYTGTKWIQCSNTGVNMDDNYIWAIISATSNPSLANMHGTPFGGGESKEKVTGFSADNIEITNDNDYTLGDGGEKGHTIILEGDSGSVASGYEVVVYWDKLQKWDGKKGFLNDTEAENDGGFEVWIKVPESPVGTHYLWFEATDQEGKVSKPFKVLSDCDISASSGLQGSKIYVDLWGFANNKEVAILFIEEGASLYDFVDTYDGSLDETFEIGEDDYDGTLEIDMVVPGKFHLHIGDYTFDDHSNGKIYSAFGEECGSINYITGEWSIDLGDTAATEAGGIFSAIYDYFVDVAPNFYVITAAGVTNELGSWEHRRITIPSSAEEGQYYVIGLDGKGNTATDDFLIGATITIDKDEGPVGTVVKIEGEGFGESEAGESFTVSMVLGTTRLGCHVIGGTAAAFTEADGDIEVEIVVPGVTKKSDGWDIEVTCGDYTPSAGFEVTGLAEVDVDPDFGPQGSKITVSGKNYPQIKDTIIVIELYNDEVTATIKDNVKTTSDGTFEVEVSVPTENDDEYKIKAYAKETLGNEFSISDTVTFRIGTILVLLSDNEGAVGEKIVLTGNGFTKSDEWNATFGDIVIFEDVETDSEGRLKYDGETPAFFVPQVEPGEYIITVWDVDAEITVDVDFTVTEGIYMGFDTYNAPNNFNVTMEGWNWPEIDKGSSNPINTNTKIKWVLYNSTDDWDMDVLQGCDDPETTEYEEPRVAEFNTSGYYHAWWIVPVDDTLSKGTYWVNATVETDNDQEYFMQLEFTIGDVHESITPRKATFRKGDTVTFNIQHSFGGQDNMDIKEGDVRIYDPDGTLYWDGDDLLTWSKIGMYYTVPYSAQTAGGNPMVLLDDAPLGKWKYVWRENKDGDHDTIAEGTFNVEAAEADILVGQIEDINQAIDDLTDDITGVTDAIAGVQSNVNSAVQAANAAVDAANKAIEAVNAVAGTASEAAEAANKAAEAAGKAQDAASGLTTLVYGAIGASLVAALAAIVSLMQISKRIAG